MAMLSNRKGHIQRRKDSLPSYSYSSYNDNDSSVNMGVTRSENKFVDCEYPTHVSPVSPVSPYVPYVPISPKKTKAKGGCSWMVSFVILMLLILACGYSYVSYDELGEVAFFQFFHERRITKAQLDEQDRTMRELEINMSTKFESKVKKLTDQNAELQRNLSDQKEEKIRNQQLTDENRQLNVRLSESKNNGDSKKNSELHKEVARLFHEKDRLTEYKKKMQQNIQLMSRTALHEKFGPEPHRVEMYVRFDNHQEETDVGYILIELAPTNELPHAVYWFLEQVSRKLYDGYSVERNLGHALMASPTNNFLSPPDFNMDAMKKRFIDEGFESILFQEYSPNFPHEKYTLGYSGRPGGPNFYLSTKDNSVIHGPGGQTHHDDPTEADTCFAKVINGFDIVDRMSQLPTKKNKILEDKVAIEYIRIIPRNVQTN